MSSLCQVSRDPGELFQKDAAPVIDCGIQKALTPSVHRLGAQFRLFYSRDTEVGRCIFSQSSSDGERWSEETLALQPDRSEVHVLCPDIVPIRHGYRMYYESRTKKARAVRSAISKDGVRFEHESGFRLAQPDAYLGSPRCVQTIEGTWRLYFHSFPLPVSMERGEQNHIRSATSPDGVNFTVEAGVRIPQTREDESFCTYGAVIVELPSSAYRMYYAGWTVEPGSRSRILSATSSDGLRWNKSPGVVINSDSMLDGQHASEPCVFELENGRFRMLYEACDENGQWRILSATTNRSST